MTISSAMSSFAAQHPAIGGIVVSLAWFHAGRQSSSGKNPDGAIAWQCFAVIIAVIAGGWAAVKGEWLGLIAVAGVLFVEVRSIRQILAITERQQ